MNEQTESQSSLFAEMMKNNKRPTHLCAVASSPATVLGPVRRTN